MSRGAVLKLRKIRTLRSKQVRREIHLRSVCVLEAARARRGRPGGELAKIWLVLLFLRHIRARVSAPSSGTKHKPNTRAPDIHASAPLSLGVERRAQASAKNRLDHRARSRDTGTEVGRLDHRAHSHFSKSNAQLNLAERIDHIIPILTHCTPSPLSPHWPLPRAAPTPTSASSHGIIAVRAALV